MDEFFEKHFQEWLTSEYSWRRNIRRKKAEVAIRDLLEKRPDLIENNYSWPEMRNMALQNW